MIATLEKSEITNGVEHDSLIPYIPTTFRASFKDDAAANLINARKSSRSFLSRLGDIKKSILGFGLSEEDKKRQGFESSDSKMQRLGESYENFRNVHITNETIREIQENNGYSLSPAQLTNLHPQIGQIAARNIIDAMRRFSDAELEENGKNKEEPKWKKILNNSAVKMVAGVVINAGIAASVTTGNLPTAFALKLVRGAISAKGNEAGIHGIQRLVSSHFGALSDRGLEKITDVNQLAGRVASFQEAKLDAGASKKVNQIQDELFTHYEKTLSEAINKRLNELEPAKPESYAKHLRMIIKECETSISRGEETLISERATKTRRWILAGITSVALTEFISTERLADIGTTISNITGVHIQLPNIKFPDIQLSGISFSLPGIGSDEVNTARQAGSKVKGARGIVMSNSDIPEGFREMEYIGEGSLKGWTLDAIEQHVPGGLESMQDNPGRIRRIVQRLSSEVTSLNAFKVEEDLIKPGKILIPENLAEFISKIQ